MSLKLTDNDIPGNIPIFKIEEFSDGECDAELVRAAEELIYPSLHNGMRVTKISGNTFGCKGASEVNRVVFPEKLRIIGYSALSGCSSLEEIVIPEGVEKISKSAFYGCHSLKRVHIPKSVREIGDVAFGDCPELSQITVDEDNPSFASRGGSLYTKDMKVLIRYAAGKEDIGFEIPEEVTELGQSCLAGAEKLTEIVISASVEQICESVFSRCDSLEKISVSEKNRKYSSKDGNLYSKDGKTLIRYAIGKKDGKFSVPEGTLRIEESAFSGANNLKSVTLPDGVSGIECFSFAFCKSLETVNIPRSVKYIGDSAFDLCESLLEIRIPKETQSVGTWAFSGCDSLGIYLEAEEDEISFEDEWNSDDRPVHYGAKID